MEISSLIRKNVLKMQPYSSARDEFKHEADVYLDANENPFSNGVNRYPDPYQNELKLQLSALKGIPAGQLLLGNGSDEVLDLIFRAFCEPREDNIVILPPTYGMYKVLAQLNAIECKEVLLKDDFMLGVPKVLEVVDQNTKLIFVCSPNNPTGNSIPLDTIIELLENTNCIVVVDEAYIDFSPSTSCLSLLARYDNLIVCQTLSKAWGMAAIRLGMCMASPEVISVLHKIKPPYNVNKLTQTKALSLLADASKMLEQLEQLKTEKKRVKEALHTLDYVEKIYPSDANFLLVKVKDANTLYDALMKQKIIVRNRTNEPLCDNCLRITIGTPVENEKLIAALNTITL